jgi:hypothetical protein
VAVRKETIRQQFDEALPAVLEPGERMLGAYGVSGPNPLWAQGLLGLAGFLILGMRYYYVALTDRRLIFMNASFWTSRPRGLAWSDPRDSIRISDLQTDNKLLELGQDLEPDQAEPPHELPRVQAPRAQGDGRRAGRPDRRSASEPRGRRRPGSGDGPGAVRAATSARATAIRAAAGAVGGLNDRRETLCYPGAVPGV